MEEYYRGRLTKFAQSRDDRARIQFQKELKKAEYLHENMIQSVGDDLFLVPSEKCTDTMYIVDPAAGHCTCFSGKLGRFCKHMAGVYKFNEDDFFLNLPAITPTARHEMAVIAFGSEAGNISMYYPLKLQNIAENTPQTSATLVTTPPAFQEDSNENPLVVGASEKEIENPAEWMKKALDELGAKLTTYGCSEKAAKKFYQSCQNISTATALETFFVGGNQRSLFLSRRSNSRIKVQTTSTARRKKIRKQKPGQE